MFEGSAAKPIQPNYMPEPNNRSDQPGAQPGQSFYLRLGIGDQVAAQPTEGTDVVVLDDR